MCLFMVQLDSPKRCEHQRSLAQSSNLTRLRMRVMVRPPLLMDCSGKASQHVEEVCRLNLIDSVIFVAHVHAQQHVSQLGFGFRWRWKSDEQGSSKVTASCEEVPQKKYSPPTSQYYFPPPKASCLQETVTLKTRSVITLL